MIPIITSRITTTCHRFARFQNARSLRLLPLLLICFLACVSCNEQGTPIVDTTPLGEGLRVIGYAVLGVGVLGVLSKLVK